MNHLVWIFRGPNFRCVTGIPVAEKAGKTFSPTMPSALDFGVGYKEQE